VNNTEPPFVLFRAIDKQGYFSPSFLYQNRVFVGIRGTKMRDYELQERISQYRWYHIIKLTDEVSTPGDPHYLPAQDLFMKHLGSLDLHGKRVLDIGCRDGLFSFAAERLGAAEVIAIDNDLSKGAVELLIPFFGSKVKMHEMSLYDLDPSSFGLFDVVLLPGVLYHLRYPFWGLRVIRSVLRDEGHLLIETPLWEAERHNAILFCPVGSDSPYDGSSCTFFNVKGIVDTLSSTGFKTVNVEPLVKRSGKTGFRSRISRAVRRAQRLLRSEDREPISSVNRYVVHSIFSGVDSNSFLAKYWDETHDLHSTHDALSVRLPELKMELPCSVCEATSFLERRIPDAALYRCPSCDHCFSALDSIDNFEEYATEYYEEIHKRWFTNPNYSLFKYIESFMREMNLSSVIDVGCGKGDFLKYIKKSHPKLSATGVDLSLPPASDEIDFVQGDVFEIDLDQKFDLVVSLATIEHIQDIHHFMRRLKDLSDINGYIIIMTVNEKGMLYKVARQLYRIGYRSPCERLYSKHHLNHFNVSSLARLLTLHKLSIVDTHYHEVPLRSVDIPVSSKATQLFLRVMVWGIFSLGRLADRTSFHTVICRK
jgi:2-polyprenyl-3-methyl-5-hydroxy-6-metoxy-1,4-benzoquinol methylase